MAVNKVYKFSDINEATLFLNGAVIGASIGSSGFPGLVGKKIKFQLPSAHEVTFVAGAGADPYTLSLADIKGQLEATVTGLLVRSFNNKLVFIESTPSGGVKIIAASASEARALLGLDPVNDIITNVYTPAVVTPTAPCWTAIENDENSMHTIYTWE